MPLLFLTIDRILALKGPFLDHRIKDGLFYTGMSPRSLAQYGTDYEPARVATPTGQGVAVPVERLRAAEVQNNTGSVFQAHVRDGEPTDGDLFLLALSANTLSQLPGREALVAARWPVDVERICSEESSGAHG